MSDVIPLYLIRTDQKVESVRSELIVFLTTLLVKLRRDVRWYDAWWMMNLIRMLLELSVFAGNDWGKPRKHS